MHEQKYKLSGEDKANVGLASIIFMLGLFFGAVMAFMVCMPLRVHAEESATVNEYYMEYRAKRSNGKIDHVRSEISTTERFALLEGDTDAYGNKTYGMVKNIEKNPAWTNVVGIMYDKDGVTVIYDRSGFSYDYYGMTVDNWEKYFTGNLQGDPYTICSYSGIDTNIPIFTDLDDAVHYINTGYNLADISTAFTDAYDPTMPVPQLGKFTHAGFEVVNAPEGDFYLQAHLDTKVYGLKIIKGAPIADNDWIYAEHTRKLGIWDVPISNKTQFNNINDWDYDNVGYLASKMLEFANAYSSHTKLPTYNFLQHGNVNKSYTGKMLEIHNMADNIGNENLVLSYLNKSVQPRTTYYVRYVQYQKSESGEYVPRYSQWMSYTVSAGFASISPVEGDASGKPINTNPSAGTLDGDGNFTGLHGSYFDSNGNFLGGNGSTYNYDTSDPLALIETFVEFVKSLPQLFGDFTLFLQAAFPFIPSDFWNFIYAALAISVPLIIIKLIK